jgi:hypothetical protein
MIRALRRAARWIGQMADLSSAPRCVTGNPETDSRKSLYCAQNRSRYVQMNIRPLYASSIVKIGTADISVAAIVPRRAQARAAGEARL